MNSTLIVALASCVPLLLVVVGYPVFLILRRNWRMEREEREAAERKRLADLAERQAQRQARRQGASSALGEAQQRLAAQAQQEPEPLRPQRAKPKPKSKKAPPKPRRTPKTRRTRFDHIDDD